MRKAFALVTLSLGLILAAGCSPKADDNVDVSLDEVVIDDGQSSNMTSNAMTPSGNMTSTADVPVVTEVPE